MDKKIVIAIDGHSSSGKSSFARALAAMLGYTVVNTGAMYRTVTLAALRGGVFPQGVLDVPALLALLPATDLKFTPEGTFLNGVDVTQQLDSLEVSDHVSAVSSVPEVRAMLLKMQRAMGADGGIVMEGRDIGTVVFPDAELKIFLTADPAVRAKRRWAQMPGVPIEDIERNIRNRDAADAARQVAPLRIAPDALVLDNSNMTMEEQLRWVADQLGVRN